MKFNQFKLIVGDYLISENSGSVQQVLGDVLREKGLTISTAESCTGGNIASLITSVSGSSAYYFGTIVSYDSSVKVNMLNVNQSDIDEFTVVSEQVSEQMAKGVRNQLKTDISISTTGVAGPNKGEDGREVGTVWISVTNGHSTLNKTYFYPYLDREDFIKIVSNNALNLAIQFVREDC